MPCVALKTFIARAQAFQGWRFLDAGRQSAWLGRHPGRSVNRSSKIQLSAPVRPVLFSMSSASGTWFGTRSASIATRLRLDRSSPDGTFPES